MFNNLQAEQARRHMINQQAADKLGLPQTSYESKKKTGRFIVRNPHRATAFTFLIK